MLAAKVFKAGSNACQRISNEVLNVWISRKVGRAAGRFNGCLLGPQARVVYVKKPQKKGVDSEDYQKKIIQR